MRRRRWRREAVSSTSQEPSVKSNRARGGAMGEGTATIAATMVSATVARRAPVGPPEGKLCWRSKPTSWRWMAPRLSTTSSTAESITSDAATDPGGAWMKG